MPESTSRRRAYFAWAAICVIWGTTYLAIRIALETLPPFLMSASRWIVAGALLIVVLGLRGETLPRPRSWPGLALLGVLLLGLGNGAVVWAELTVPSGLTAVLVATNPFWMVGIEAVRTDGERITAKRAAGLLLGFLGIVLLIGEGVPSAGGGALIAGVVSTQVACAGWALGSTYARRRGQHENVLAAAAFEMLFGGLALLAVGLALGEARAVTYNARSLGALLYLTVAGSIGGFTAYAYALKHLPVSTVSLYSYINPVIAVVLGTLLLHEPFNARVILGGAVIAAGIVLVRRRG